MREEIGKGKFSVVYRCVTSQATHFMLDKQADKCRVRCKVHREGKVDDKGEGAAAK